MRQHDLHLTVTGGTTNTIGYTLQSAVEVSTLTTRLSKYF